MEVLAIAKPGIGAVPGKFAAEFEAVALSQKQKLFGAAFSILRDHAEAEDAVQETLVKAWKAWASVRSQESREAWLLRICVNHCINRRTSLGRRGWRGWLPLGDQQSSRLHPRAEGALLDLDRAFLKLSARQRAVLFLHLHHGYSIDECAAMMDLAPGTVRSHLARAIARLREEMRDG